MINTSLLAGFAETRRLSCWLCSVRRQWEGLGVVCVASRDLVRHSVGRVLYNAVVGSSACLLQLQSNPVYSVRSQGGSTGVLHLELPSLLSSREASAVFLLSPD